jgi:hypothetical protein
MTNKIIEYRKKHPRCRYCKHTYQNNFGWKCLAKNKIHIGSVSETIFRGMLCGLFEFKED